MSTVLLHLNIVRSHLMSRTVDLKVHKHEIAYV